MKMCNTILLTALSFSLVLLAPLAPARADNDRVA